MTNKSMMRASRLLPGLIAGLLLLGAMSLVGCSDDDPEEGPGISVRDDASTSDARTGDADAGNADISDGSDASDGTSTDADSGSNVDGGDANDAGDAGDAPDVDPVPACPQTPCADDKICVEGRCLEETPANKCAAARDLGELSPGAPITISDTTAGATDVLSSDCTGSSGNERIYQFTVSQNSRVSFQSDWPAQFDATMEFRFESCETPDARTACFDANSSLSVSAGQTVYLIVEQTVGRGNDFSLVLSAEPEACTPGETTCTDGSLTVCGTPTARNCAAECAPAGQQCNGTLCENAISLSASASFAGDLAAYQANFDFETNPSCTLNGTPIPTPGAEVIFKLEGLNAGQVVSVNAGPGRAMFFTTDCQPTPTCEAALTSAGSSGAATWTVPAGFSDQDVYLIIDRRNRNAGAFNYEIDISAP